MAAIASGYFLICLVKLSIGFVFRSASVQTAGKTPSLGAQGARAPPSAFERCFRTAQ